MQVYVKRLINFLINPALVFYLLIWLMVLTVGGTLAQRDLGLFQAQQIYFSSYIFWFRDMIPLPGGYPTMGLLFFGVLAKLIFGSKWKPKMIGINVVHIGALLLLFGGYLTAAFSHEGSMVIPEGDTVGFYSDYHKAELAVIETTSSEHDKITAFGDGWFTPGAKFGHKEVPFTFETLEYCQNCTISRREQSVPENYRGFSKNFLLVEKPLDKEAEQNVSGLQFRISGAGPDLDGIYSIFEYMPIEQKLKVGDRTFILTLRKEQTHLPFKIELIDFEQKVYPGTQMAKSYRSVVNLIEKDFRQKTIVQMNEPLRYKGYTFYQASFLKNGSLDTTVLAVVKNVGRLFPYISSLIMCFGLLIHLTIQVPHLIQGRKES